MINLRYHIVSLVAVFLALAIGIFTGSTLLERATVDYLKASRDRVDARNDELVVTNEAWRQFAEVTDRVETGFAQDALGPLVAGRLERRVVLTIATRGIDEPTIERFSSTLRASGADSLGVLWLDERTDLSDGAALTSISSYLKATEPTPKESADTTVAPQIGGPSANSAVGRALLQHIANALAPLEAPAAAPTPTPTPTASTPDSSAVAPSASTGANTEATPSTLPSGPAEATRDSAGLLRDLVDAGLADWTDPTGRLDTPPELPDDELSVVVLGGEGAVVAVDVATEPLVEQLVAAGVRTVFGEIRRPRPGVEAVEGESVPDRGSFIGGIRANDELTDAVVTVDNVDSSAGVIAVVLALAGPDGPIQGKYGVASSAERPFPPPG